nr:MAG TPA: hypothetical protein [Caudoviricetes sp.]
MAFFILSVSVIYKIHLKIVCFLFGCTLNKVYICIVELNYTAKVKSSTPQNNVKIYKKDWNNQIRKGEIVCQ